MPNVLDHGSLEPLPGSSEKERAAQAAKIRWAMCALHIESTSVAGQHLEDVIRWLEKGKAPEPRAGRCGRCEGKGIIPVADEDTGTTPPNAAWQSCPDCHSGSEAPGNRAGQDIEEKAREWFQQEYGRWYPRTVSWDLWEPPTPQKTGREGFKAGHRAGTEKMAEAVQLIRRIMPRTRDRYSIWDADWLRDVDEFLAQFQEGNPDADV